MSFIDHYETQLVQAGHRRIERRLRNRIARWLRTPRRRGAAAVLAALVVAAPAAAATFGWNPFDDPGRDPRVGTPSATEAPPADALTSNLAVLRRPQTEAERRSVEAQFSREGAFADVSGVHVDYIRVVAGPRRVVLVPVERFGLKFEQEARRNPAIPAPNRADFSDAVCLYDARPAGASARPCFTARRITGGTALTTEAGTTIGLVPDGVATVRLTDGSVAAEAPVRDNVYVAGPRAPAMPSLVEWLDERGETIKRIDLTGGAAG